MFFHILKYELRSAIRAKTMIIWLLLFPICLSTFFKLAFDSVYEKTTAFETTNAAVVEVKEDEILKNVLLDMDKQDKPLIHPIFTDEDQAMELLDKGEVSGVIFVDDTPEIRSSVRSDDINVTILKSFMDIYSVRKQTIMDTAKNDPAKVMEVSAAMSSEISTHNDICLTKGETDNTTQYFYNAIAMVALFGILAGLHVSIFNQADLSYLGARNNCAPVSKTLSMLASFTGSALIMALDMVICVSYIRFVLGISFGDRLPLVYLCAILGGVMSVSIGFFIGVLGKMKIDDKTGICVGIIMALCFLSGLMVANVKNLIAVKIPALAWINDVNPAAVISDSLYCLNIYEDYHRLTTKIITMLVTTVLFFMLGIIFTRRKRYASL